MDIQKTEEIKNLLGSAGIIDITDRLGFDHLFRGDLFDAHATHEENLRDMIGLALCRIQIWREKEGFVCDAPLYIFATKQGVHIEMDQELMEPACRPHKKIPHSAVESLFNKNRGKIALAADFFEHWHEPDF